MLLAIDIGNSSTKFGVFDGRELVSRIVFSTSRTAGASYIADEIAGRLRHEVHAAIIASVVPEMDQPIREYLQLEHNIDPVFVDHDTDFGLKISYRPITALGIDRLVNAFAGASLYGKPCIVCSLGTATTIDAVGGDGYLGGIIAPGIQTMAKALHLATSKLPEVAITRPETVLGNSTAGSIRSGIFYGYVEMVDGLIGRIVQDVGFATEAEGLNIVATGGSAEAVAAEIPAITRVDPNLVLEGLRLLFEKQFKRTSAET